MKVYFQGEFCLEVLLASGKARAVVRWDRETDTVLDVFALDMAGHPLSEERCLDWCKSCIGMSYDEVVRASKTC